MKNKKHFFGVGAGAVFVAVAIFIVVNPPNPGAAPKGPLGGMQPAPQNSSSYTMAQVAAHNSGASCWTAIAGTVYDVTSFISQHPGGAAAILSLCGTDGTAAFVGQHGDPHAHGRPQQELAGFQIGTLK